MLLLITLKSIVYIGKNYKVCRVSPNLVFIRSIWSRRFFFSKRSIKGRKKTLEYIKSDRTMSRWCVTLTRVYKLIVSTIYLTGCGVLWKLRWRVGVSPTACIIPLWLHDFELFHGLLTLWSKSFSWSDRPTVCRWSLFPELFCFSGWLFFLRGGGVGDARIVENDISSSESCGGFIPVSTNSANTSTPYSDWSYFCITSIKNSIGFSPFGSFRPKRPKWSPTSFGGPWYMSWPRASIIRWSSRSRIRCEGWWIVRITVLPARAILWTFSTTLWALVESKPDVGSSRKRSDGPWIMSTPIETLRRSPPETPRLPSSPIYVFLAV